MDRCGEIFLCELCKGGRGKIARSVARFSKAIMTGREWLRSTFVMCVMWTFAQFTVGAFPSVVQEFYREPEVSRYTLVGTLSRIGFMPSPLLLDSDLAQMSVLVAALLQLILTALLGVACRVHTLEMDAILAAEMDFAVAVDYAEMNAPQPLVSSPRRLASDRTVATTLTDVYVEFTPVNRNAQDGATGTPSASPLRASASLAAAALAPNDSILSPPPALEEEEEEIAARIRGERTRHGASLLWELLRADSWAEVRAGVAVVLQPIEAAYLAALRVIAWHSPKLSLVLVLIAGLYVFDLLHAVYVLLYVLLASRSTDSSRVFWPILVRWVAITVLLSASFLVVAPPEADEPSWMLTLLGLNGPSGAPNRSAATGWKELGPDMVLFMLLVIQDAIYRSVPFRRAFARRNWALARACHLPHINQDVRQSRFRWRAALRWVTFFMVLAVSLVPRARVQGLIYLLAFVWLLYFDQAANWFHMVPVTLRRGRAWYEQYVIYPVIIGIVLIELALRYAIAIPFVAKEFFSSAGLFPQCDLGSIGSANQTACQLVLDALGLHPVTAPYDRLSVRLELVLLSMLLVASFKQRRVTASDAQQDGAAQRPTQRPTLQPIDVGSGASPRSSGARPRFATRPVGSGNSTELMHVSVRAYNFGPSKSILSSSRWVTPATIWAIVTHTTTAVLVVVAFGSALAYVDAQRFFYASCSIMACVLGEWAVSSLWLPIGVFSALSLLTWYLFQLELTDSWLSEADKIWIGLDHLEIGLDSLDSTSDLFAVGVPVFMQLLALFQRHSQLAHKDAQWRAAMYLAAGTIGAPAKPTPAVCAVPAPPSSSSQALLGAPSLVLLPSFGGASTASLRPPMAREATALHRQPGLLSNRRRIFAAANLQHRLLRCWGAVLPPLAQYMVLFAACMRLNLWAVLYVIAIGMVNFCYLGRPVTPLAWKLLRLLIGVALIVQYCALLSLPDSVWPTDAPDGGRPWLFWGRNWSYVSAECARLHLDGSPPPSGMVCYMSVTGQPWSSGQQPWMLMIDFCALLACLLAEVNKTAAHAVSRTDLAEDGGLQPPADLATEPSPPPSPPASSSPSSDTAGIQIITPSKPPPRVPASSGAGPEPATAAAAASAPTDVASRSKPSALPLPMALAPWLTWMATLTEVLRLLEVYTVRLSHVVILFIVLGLAAGTAATSRTQDATQGLISLGFIIYSLFYIAFERMLVAKRGRQWCWLVVYSWCVLLATQLFQAPITPPDECWNGITAEEEGQPWCSLILATIGLFPVQAFEATGLSLVKFATIWLLVDVQRRLFGHRSYSKLNMKWREQMDDRGQRRALEYERREAIMRQLYTRRLEAWDAMQAAKLRRILERLETIRSLLLGGSSASSSSEPPKQLQRADEVDVGVSALIEAGFDGRKAAAALVACGAGGKRSQEVLGAYTLHRALTLLLQVELELVPPSTLHLREVTKRCSVRKVQPNSMTYKLLEEMTRQEDRDSLSVHGGSRDNLSSLSGGLRRSQVGTRVTFSDVDGLQSIEQSAAEPAAVEEGAAAVEEGAAAVEEGAAAVEEGAPAAETPREGHSRPYQYQMARSETEVGRIKSSVDEDYDMFGELMGKMAGQSWYEYLREHFTEWLKMSRDPVLFPTASSAPSDMFEMLRYNLPPPPSDLPSASPLGEAASVRTRLLGAIAVPRESCWRLATLATQAACSNSFFLLAVAMVLNHAIVANKLSIVFPLALLLYGATDSQMRRVLSAPDEL